MPAHYGVTNGRHELIQFYELQLNAWELFDLDEDPQELHNVYDDADYSDVVRRMKDELRRLQKAYHVN